MKWFTRMESEDKVFVVLIVCVFVVPAVLCFALGVLYVLFHNGVQ